jgi:hypothetical protein
LYVGFGVGTVVSVPGGRVGRAVTGGAAARRRIRVAVDVAGADFGPEPAIAGALAALADPTPRRVEAAVGTAVGTVVGTAGAGDLEVTLVGPQRIVRAMLPAHLRLPARAWPTCPN